MRKPYLFLSFSLVSAKFQQCCNGIFHPVHLLFKLFIYLVIYFISQCITFPISFFSKLNYAYILFLTCAGLLLMYLRKNGPSLTTGKYTNICLNVAKGLEYFHENYFIYRYCGNDT